MDKDELCLDTGLLIAFLKGREPGATAVRSAVESYTCHVTALTVYELLFGVARSRKEIGEENLLSVMKVAALGDVAARIAAKLHDDLLRSGNDIGIKDVLVAAICLERGLPILTLNERHFMRVPGLTVLTPATLAA